MCVGNLSMWFRFPPHSKSINDKLLWGEKDKKLEEELKPSA
jgi:hypothetical protein